ncbi:MAG: hypothetical protein A4S09_13550 [Proteobacteria bacterium SG_bin7]|nr:MAG: hypothetical protein A4S09_13550 [Proteobacteria bacterium SG_bin7]
MDIFDFKDYKEFTLNKLKQFARLDRGQSRKLAQHLNVNSVVISQILKGERDFTEDQSFEVSDFLGLNEFEREYFILLVRYARAGTYKYKSHLKKKLQEVSSKSKDLKSRVTATTKLTEESKALFYSNWYYIAISLATALKDCRTIESISQRLNLSRPVVRKTMDFLIQNGLCVETKSGYEMGSRVTHLESTSGLVTRHHTNWRLKALEKMGGMDSEELFYSGPMVISQSLQTEIRKRLVQVIQENVKLIKDCPDETLMCLNIDWFKI